MAHAIVRTDNLSGTTLGKDLVAIRYQEGSVDKEIDNGNVVVVGAFLVPDVRIGTKPAANSNLADVALIASEEIVKSDNDALLSDFYNKAGVNARGYRLRTGDQFSVTAEALDGAASVGKIVELQASTKLKVVSSLTSSSTKVGTIVAADGNFFTIEVA